MTTIQLYDEPTTLTLREVADQLAACGAFALDGGEDIGEVRLEFGSDLEIDIVRRIEDDPRCSGYLDHTETLGLSDICQHFTLADHYAWGKDASGDDCLYCFGC